MNLNELEAVVLRAERAGIVKSMTGTWTPEDDAQLADLYALRREQRTRTHQAGVRQ
ncbi:hypothetical protein FM104_09375 [Microbacterium esteraromaticum]|uniref:Uncharacterized protein n=1 Tax=Microbacterium esteraromaticum TaxID=57043 RepID=A0A1R4JXV4_9MICO|nr:hypothetical protein [Microbacterium esteraromaticum]SJN36887.1 hypothetical protein FM104_09375 [Microbacterium esteraromaticum]